MIKEDETALLEWESFKILWNIQKRLHGGSDKERDLGHDIWHILCSLPVVKNKDLEKL
jgi:hypothetical protein